jgi:hypothetical protein
MEAADFLISLPDTVKSLAGMPVSAAVGRAGMPAPAASFGTDVITTALLEPVLGPPDEEVHFFEVADVVRWLRPVSGGGPSPAHSSVVRGEVRNHEVTAPPATQKLFQRARDVTSPGNPSHQTSETSSFARGTAVTQEQLADPGRIARLDRGISHL